MIEIKVDSFGIFFISHAIIIQKNLGSSFSAPNHIYLIPEYCQGEKIKMLTEIQESKISFGLKRQSRERQREGGGNRNDSQFNTKVTFRIGPVIT